MTTPHWLESEQQRIKRERRLARIESAIGVTAAAVWVLIIVEAIRGFVR